MRIGVYLMDFDPTYAGGLNTYAAGLVRGLTRCSRRHRVVVFAGTEAQAELERRIGSTSDGTFFVPVESPRGRLAEHLTLLPLLEHFHEAARNRRMRKVSALIAAHCDVVLFPMSFLCAYELTVPSIVSFHDLQHERYPEFFAWRVLRGRRVRFAATFRHATLIQASSAAMKEEALRVYGDRISAERIAVIPEGVDYALFSGEPPADARREYGLPEEFMFYPAQMWHHKNHLRLLQALDALRERNSVRIPLVLTGSEYEAARAVRQFIADRRLGEQVYLLGKVPHSALRSLYRQARYVLSASLYESSCLPVLEAAAAGSALIVSDIPPNRESSQVFSLRLFDPLDVESMCATLLEAWENRCRNREAVDANRDAARRFDWAAIAEMFVKHAERLAPPRGVKQGPQANRGDDSLEWQSPST
jgi:glycosyltransferase involved in cell wall biosynthesis